MRSLEKDTGWSWVVLVASAASLYLFVILAASTGFLQVELMEDLNAGAGPISLMSSLVLGQSCVLGPLSALLATLLSVRVTVYLGVTLLSGGLFVASFSQSFATLTFFYGCVTGFGFGVAYTACVMVISFHFERYRLMANGVIMCAPGLGLLSLPYLVTWSISQHGWRWTMAMNAGIVLHIAVLASLFFPTDMEQQTMVDWSRLLKRCLRRESGGGADGKKQGPVGEVKKHAGLLKNNDLLKGKECYEDILKEKECVESENKQRDKTKEGGVSVAAKCGGEILPEKQALLRRISGLEPDDREVSKSTDVSIGIFNGLEKPTAGADSERHVKYVGGAVLNRGDLKSIGFKNGVLYDNELKNSLKTCVGPDNDNHHSCRNGEVKPLISKDTELDYILQWEETSKENGSLKSLPLNLYTLKGASAGVPSSPLTHHTKALPSPRNDQQIYPEHTQSKHLNASAENVTNNDSMFLNAPLRIRSQSSVSNHSYCSLGVRGRNHQTSLSTAVSGSTLVGRAHSWINSQADVMGSSLLLPIKVEEIEPDGETGSQSSNLRANLKMVLCNRAVWMLSINCFCFIFGYGMVMVHFPAFAEEKGVSREYVSRFYTAYGLTMMLSRLGGGVTLNIFRSNPPLVTLSCVLHIFMGLTIGLSPFYATTMAGLFAMQILQAFSFGVGYMLFAPICVQIMGVELLAISFGLVQLFNGIAYISSPVVAGFLYDITGSFDAPFMVGGVIVVLGVAPLLIIKCTTSPMTSEPNQSESEVLPAEVEEGR